MNEIFKGVLEFQNKGLEYEIWYLKVDKKKFVKIFIGRNYIYTKTQFGCALCLEQCADTILLLINIFRHFLFFFFS